VIEERMAEAFNLHSWRLNDRGQIDEFAYTNDRDFHNGPICEVCGFVFCVHCEKRRPKSGWENECEGIAPERLEEVSDV